MTATRRRVFAAPVLVLAFALAGCTSATPTPSATSTSSSASPSRTATPAPAPSYRPDGTAQANKAWFDSVNTKFFAANSGANGRAIIDSLVSAGFDKAAMQVTPDRTSINGGVDSILFSVKIGDSCLLGQHGGGGYSSAVEKALTSGLCIIGKTRPIDW
ncbi:DUF6993 domain-containing protein [Lacisediminihabitans sp. FW035]